MRLLPHCARRELHRLCVHDAANPVATFSSSVKPPVGRDERFPMEQLLQYRASAVVQPYTQAKMYTRLRTLPQVNCTAPCCSISVSRCYSVVHLHSAFIGHQQSPLCQQPASYATILV
jgi:hypothetical protein